MCICIKKKIMLKENVYEYIDDISWDNNKMYFCHN